MTTEDIVVLDQQAKETLNEIQKMSSMFVKSFLSYLFLAVYFCLQST